MRNGEGRFALQGPPDSAKLGVSIRHGEAKRSPRLLIFLVLNGLDPRLVLQREPDLS